MENEGGGLRGEGVMTGVSDVNIFYKYPFLSV